MKYFIGDLHLGHKNIIKFERSEFSTIEEHDNHILNILSNKLTKNDTLYVLGDFCFYLSDEIKEKWKNLPCQKIFVYGNHDKQSEEFYKSLFHIVYKNPVFLNKRVLLSHYPMPVTDGTLNLHGHIHNGIISKKNYLNMNAYNLSYIPFTEKQVLSYLEKLERDSWKYQQEWYKDLEVKVAANDKITNQIKKKY